MHRVCHAQAMETGFLQEEKNVKLIKPDHKSWVLQLQILPALSDLLGVVEVA